MDEKEKAAAICDKIGLTDENERFWFIRGYCRGAIDARIEHINEAIDAMSRVTKTIPHETR